MDSADRELTNAQLTKPDLNTYAKHELEQDLDPYAKHELETNLDPYVEHEIDVSVAVANPEAPSSPVDMDNPDPTSQLPEEPMVYEVKKKKKKKKKKHKKSKIKDTDPFEEVDVKANVKELGLDPNVTVKVENIECEIDFQAFANTNGLMVEGPDSDYQMEVKTADSMRLSFESVCSDKSVFGYQLDKNINNPITFICNMCNLVFNTANTLRIHKKRKHNSYMKSFKFICDICDISYEKKNSLVAHITRKHRGKSVPEDKEERTCEICSLSFAGMPRLRMHMRRKHDSFRESFEHKCPHCGLSYEKIQSLAVHIQRKHNQKPLISGIYNCPFCPRLFTVRDTFTKHVQRKHKISNEVKLTPEDLLNVTLQEDESGEFTCSECALVFSDVNKLKIHMRRKHNAYEEFFKLKCNTCNLSYDKSASLKRHIRRKHDRLSYCFVCQKQFDTRELYVNHSHDPSVITCYVCGKICTSKRALTKHIRWTHRIDLEINTFFCDVCNDGFSKKRQLGEHLRKEHLKKQYNCMHCDLNFVTKESYRRHVLRNHSVTTVSYNKCDRCDNYFPNEQELCRHIDAAHSKIAKIEVKSEGPFVCAKCPEQFETWSLLTEHDELCHCVEKTEKCKHCNLTLRINELMKHVKSVHNISNSAKEEPTTLHNCDYCDYETYLKANLTKHLLRHSNKPPMICEQEGCNFQTHYNSAMKNHKAKHMDVRDRVRIQCPQCPFQSFNKYTMKYHQDEHLTGRKKFSCNECSYETAMPANLTQHKYKHSVEKKFRCELCPFASKYNTSLRHHMKKKHCDLPVDVGGN